MKRLSRWASAVFFLLLAIGIAVTVAIEPYQVAARPIVQQPEMTPTAFVMSDGSRLPYFAWRPAEGPQLAVVIAIHGGGHHAATMSPLGEFLRDRQMVTYAYDLRGHGGAPDYGKWPGAEAIQRDLGEIIALVRSHHP